ncbi:von Willebrand factor type A domain-containing protein [Neorhodopirellula lusitana]|uniref:von Willebrand factor type A domain-containing protein n=1 Tax=Neorhodopirellula lusitana TaxID=445327 RepID=A0ABY1QM07_9BACT|nr:vWA domain-containing protein [Neorhodopirellula lusitana]SMP74677.1 von Willebrand factor type A domain-containing protein [Neorhodopirellula lusitana]
MRFTNSVASCLIAALWVTPSLITVTQADEITIKIETKESTSPDEAKSSPFSGQRATVDVAILLDTSSSMDGLINQARSQLWNIVQEFMKAKKAGKTPLLRVAVMEYGNSGLPATEDYIRQVVPMTDDLDKVSEGLFALSTNGGDEYCGSVIKESLKRLDWSTEPGGYKAIFIAGNEPFDQGSVDYKAACKNAIQQGVVVNTIHCGNRNAGVRGHWKEGADLAEGKFMNIDQDERVVHIKAPQDKIIIELNAQLNKTYLWYGKAEKRQAYQMNQARQDSNAGGSGGLSSRAKIKSSSIYRNVGRDLVDTFEESQDAVKDLDESKLPESLKSLSPEQRVAEIQRLSKLRTEIKSKLAEASKQRDAFVQAEQKKLAESSGETFGDAFSAAVSEQLQQAGFQQSQ